MHSLPCGIPSSKLNGTVCAVEEEEEVDGAYLP